MTSSICYSGGAPGSDMMFAHRARVAGHAIRNISFEGHGYNGVASERVVVPGWMLATAEPYLKNAAAQLNRPGALVANQYVKKLLLRNFFQIEVVDRLYAVGWITDDVVEGGTAWAIEMFRSRLLREYPESSEAAGTDLLLPIWIYDQNAFCWKRLTGHGWEGTKVSQIPKPEGLYAGIGSRRLNHRARASLESLYEGA